MQGWKTRERSQEERTARKDGREAAREGDFMLVFVSHNSKDVAPLHKSLSLEILRDVVNGVWF